MKRNKSRSVALGSLVGLATLALSACALPPLPAPAVGQPAEKAAEAPILPAATVAVPAEPAPAVPLYKNLGSHTRKIITSSPLAQQYFDQGLTLTYAFNHAEAIKMFKEAARLDPNCAMCHWGIAYALGPHINAPMDAAAVPEAYATVQKAEQLSHDGKDGAGAAYIEHELIHALTARYAAEPMADRSSLDKAYADAMRVLAKKYPQDDDIGALFAESLMDLTPWNFWTKDGQATTYTDEIVTTLDSVLALNPMHPAANHYYIHATEASPNPERAVPSAERLMTLVPDAGHLVHMPAHTFWRVGRYHDAAEINKHAIHSDEGNNFSPDRGGQGLYAVGYYPHNIHFLQAATSMEGRSAETIAAARKLAGTLSPEVIQAVPVLESFPPMALLALARFGKWDDILNEPQPPESLKYTTGIWHYARGMAFVRKGDLEAAGKELAPLKELAASKEMESLGLSTFATAGQLLMIAAETLEGELFGAQGETDHQIGHLEEAVRMQDELPYFEPPAWYFPTRQALGAALLDAGKAQEAEAVYRADLTQYPNNAWSLFGLTQSLKAQGKDADAAAAQKQFEEAWQYADVTLTRSSF
jgi:tetratricopeptide (TPR) repeat protein